MTDQDHIDLTRHVVEAATSEYDRFKRETPYKIVQGSKENVEQEVSDLLRQGWQLSGGVTTLSYSDPRIAGVSFAQAMVRPMDDDEEIV